MTQPNEMEGHLIGAYRLTRELGRGGMGVVYEARHTSLGRRAAVKLLLSEFSRKPEIVARFINEARAVNIIQHPGIVDISDVGTAPSGEVFIIMEFLEGESLGQRLNRAGRIDVPTALRIGAQVAAALAAAHAKGIIHRDLKPENVMLINDGLVAGGARAKLLDFGIAKLAAEHADPAGGGLRTMTDLLMGTPTYMSPEQCRGAGGVTDRSDVYSLGVLLFRSLAGRAPFTGTGPGDIIAMHLVTPPPPLPGVPAKVAALVARMLSKRPEDRPAMTAVVDELTQLAAAPTVAPRRSQASAQQPSQVSASEAPGEVRLRPTPRWGLMAGVGGLLILVSGGLILREVGRGRGGEKAGAAVQTVNPPSAPPAERPVSPGGAAAAPAGSEAVSPPPVAEARVAGPTPAPTIVDPPPKQESTGQDAGKVRPVEKLVRRPATNLPAKKVIADNKQPTEKGSANSPSASRDGDRASVTNDKADPGANVVDEEKLEQAKIAYVEGNAARAIQLAREAGKSSKGWRIIGAAACNLKDLKLAAEAYRNLDGSGKMYMTYACQRNQVSVSGGKFAPFAPDPWVNPFAN